MMDGNISAAVIFPGEIQPEPETDRQAAGEKDMDHDIVRIFQLFFDDTPRNVEAARKHGYNAEVFTDIETAKKMIENC